MTEADIEKRARAMHDTIAEKHGLPPWEQATDAMRAIWRRTAKELHEIDTLMDWS